MKNLRKKSKRKLRIRRRPINVLASAMTTFSLYLGTASIFASIGNEYERAAYLILTAIIFDMLDGTVARLTRSVSEFGKQLDSLCDLVSFGVAPAVLVFAVYLQHAPKEGSFVGKTGAFVAIIYVICAALRLARFNVYQADRRESFVGLPSPAAGATVAAFVLFLRFFGFIKSNFDYYAVGALTLLMAWLMVSTVRYPKDKMKSFILAPRHAFMALGIIAYAMAIIHYAITISPAIVLFPVAATYVLFGMCDTAYTYVTGQDQENEPEATQPAATAAAPVRARPAPGNVDTGQHSPI
ncbi:MAG: CDP-diacylglycerol--serine O-phosphatidyltransferase [Candidatus Hydrogenedentes bacterium]|nr:CDP-diacylglycerol--serine O-phosphatidyltransferase [Candidatus Hydrogenedentota bacterium]